MPRQREIKRVLIVVRTYPTPAKTGVEVSCTAGITKDREWIRLFPVPYRLLDDDKRFRKYQWIDVDVMKASDRRRESYRIVNEGIRIISAVPPDHAWAARRKIIEPLRAPSLCSLKRERDQHKTFPTLGLFRPKSIKRLVFEAASPTWTRAQLAMLRQGTLFENPPDRELEKVPYTFSYRFGCDDAACSGHMLSCTDWEMGQSWRSWRTKYGEGWQEKFRQKYETEMIEKFDTQFFVGTVNRHPKEWIIVGLYYPPKVAAPAQPGLFDSISN